MKVITFNLRAQTDADGANAWRLRKEAAVRLIRSERPAVLGTQEGTEEMLAYLDGRLPEYIRLGASRRGRGAGEHSAVYVRRDAATIVDSGDFWLSDKPHVPGSRSFGNRIPAVATWVRLRLAGGDQEWLICNTHLDHESAAARERSAVLIDETLRELSAGPAVLMGDFNDEPDSLCVSFLTGKRAIGGRKGRWRDALEAADERRDADVGTFHAFRGRPGARRRVDFIFVSPGVRVAWAGPLITPEHEPFVSDHFPVSARIRL